jgi:hypothetical protein
MLLQIPETSADEQMAILRLLNTQVKLVESNEESLKALSGLGEDLFTSNGVKLYYFYLLAKGFRLKFEKGGEDYSDLEQAGVAIYKTFSIARDNSIKIKNVKFYFAQAYIAHLISSKGEHVIHRYHAKAYFTLKKALPLFPNNKSLLWLHNQVKAFAKTNGTSFPKILIEQ